MPRLPRAGSWMRLSLIMTTTHPVWPADLLEKGAQPAIYINSYGGYAHLREAVDTIYQTAVAQGFADKIWRLLPFVNAMHEKYDFTWEREWRVLGNLKFSLSDVVCVILPPGGNADI